MIQLKDISVSFNKGTPLETPVFDHLNLKVNRGDFITLIGGNGAGKSTLLNVIAGEITGEGGQIILEDRDVTHQANFLRAGEISRVFQDPLLGSYAELTIEENLSLALSRGQKRSLVLALKNPLREMFREKLASIGIGLENRLKDRMGLLSGGQRQAVSLIMATIKPSKVLLLDEHTAALDPKMENLVLALTQKLITEQNLTALMITHCMSQALEFGNRTLVMHHGKIVKDLSREERERLCAKDLISFF